jgi:aspartyl-tRNA(Asn)/glutamyl-tRNA(Gln) amidotransferase subunit A
VDDLVTLSASDLLAGYAARRLSPVEVVDAHAARIEEVEPQLRAFVTLTLDEAREEARRSERAWATADARALEGVPFAAKDLFDTAGVRATYGSRMFVDHVPRADAEAVRLTREAGAILLGKTSTHEFAWGVTSYNAAFESGRNPWDLGRVTGGSSGGSGAALAAHLATLALGSDTGGSIRIPAAFCGVTGLKPTFARVGAAGVFPLAPSLDTVGPLARTPDDVALLLSVLAREQVTPSVPERPLRVAVSADLVPLRPTPGIDAALASARAVLAGLGCELVDEPFPEAADVLPAFLPIQGAEALAVHGAAGLWPERRSGYGDDVRGRLEAAEAVTLDAYREATLAREGIRAGFVRMFRRSDVLLTPVSALPPVHWGSDAAAHLGRPILFREAVLPFTTPQNLAGLPSCVVRAGFDEFGLPVGVQLTTRAGHEELLLGLARRFHAATPDVQRRRPQLPGSQRASAETAST